MAKCIDCGGTFPEPNPTPIPIPIPMPTQAIPPSWLVNTWTCCGGRTLIINANGSLSVIVGGISYNGIFTTDNQIFLNNDYSSVAQDGNGQLVTTNLTSGGQSVYAPTITTQPPVTVPPVTIPPTTTTPPTSTTQPVTTQPISTTDPTTGTITTQYPDGTVTVTDPKTGVTQTVVQGTSNTILDFVKQNPLLVAGGAALVAYLILGE